VLVTPSSRLGGSDACLFQSNEGFMKESKAKHEHDQIHVTEPGVATEPVKPQSYLDIVTKDHVHPVSFPMTGGVIETCLDLRTIIRR
jgi:hypothetical protein